MMLPAEFLNAAAVMVREAAAKATPGPWIIYPTIGVGDRRDDAWTVSTGYCDKADGAECLPECGRDVVVTGARRCEEDLLRADDAEWIALLSPAAAPHLVVLLESVAAQLAGNVHSGNDYCDLPLAIAGQVGDGGNSCKCPDVHAALGFARTILGEAP